MATQKITNTSPGPRGLNVRGNGDAHIPLMVMPGQTVDVEVFDPGNPVYQAWSDGKEMDFEGGVPQAPDPKQRKAADAKQEPPKQEPPKTVGA